MNLPLKLRRSRIADAAVALKIEPHSFGARLVVTIRGEDLISFGYDLTGKFVLLFQAWAWHEFSVIRK